MAKKAAGAVRVMIVDDHAVVREGLRNFLGMLPAIDLVAEAASGVEAIDLAPKAKPQVVLMDLMMPEMDGVEATRAILQANPETRILALTSFGEEDLVRTELQAGAMGYLLKNVAAPELAQAIRAARVGRPTLAGEAAMALLGTGKGLTTVGDALTHREPDVL